MWADMTMTLKIINPEDDQRWDEFVAAYPQGMIYHHSAWGKVLQSTFDYTPFYVALEGPADGRIEGILPFMLVKSRVTGNRLVSLPFTTYCTRLVSASQLENIVKFALEHHPGIDFLELKFLEDLEDVPGFLKKQSSYVTHFLNLDLDLDELFRSFHNTSICQRIKRAEKSGLKLRFAEREEDLEKYYDLHMMVRKNHGLPPHPYSFFLNMWNILRSKNFLSVPLVEYEGKIIAGAIVLKFKDTFHLEYSASDQRYIKQCPNQFLIWEIIKTACLEGVKSLDFGRSSLLHVSLMEFKERWGARRQNLAYYYYPEASRMETESGVKKRILSSINRLLPKSLLRLEGEILYRHLG
jgi:hypothetical protein